MDFNGVAETNSINEGVIARNTNDTFWLEKTWEYFPLDQQSPRSRQLPYAPVETTAPPPPTGGQTRPQATDFPVTVSFERTSPSLDVHHASPLAPLRQRDASALNDFFEDDRIQDIALDIHRYLARTYPEPCWEDEPFEFLNGYI